MVIGYRLRISHRGNPITSQFWNSARCSYLSTFLATWCLTPRYFSFVMRQSPLYLINKAVKTKLLWPGSAHLCWNWSSSTSIQQQDTFPGKQRFMWQNITLSSDQESTHGTRYEPHANSHPYRTKTRKLHHLMNKALDSVLSANARTQDNEYWKQFCAFMFDIGHPACPAYDCHVALYVTYLHTVRLKTTPIRLHLAAIAYKHKIQGHESPTNTFLITQLLVSYRKMDSPPQTSKLIRFKLLLQLVYSIRVSTSDQFNRYLYITAFSLLYHAALRCGEICFSNLSNHAISFKNVKIKGPGSTKRLTVGLRSHKHHKGVPLLMIIHSANDFTCPSSNPKHFQKLRG